MTRYFIVALFVWSIFTNVQAGEVRDDAQHVIKLTQPACRIISLAPDLTESLFAIGAGARIVGVVQGSDYPAAATVIPVVANFNAPDVERILALHPDLIVVWADSRLAEPLKKLGIPIYYSHPQKLLDIPATLQRLGCLTGNEKMAGKVAQKFLRQYYALQKQYSRQANIKVFYQIWSQPLLTISKSSWINDVIELCNGKNIFANLTGAAPEVGVEAVVRANPDVIINAATQVHWQTMWLAWPTLIAVQKHKLFTINPDLIERASPRILAGATLICQYINQNSS